MLDLKFLRENLDEVEKRLASRGGTVDLGDFRALDDSRRGLLSEAESLKAERNQVSALIGRTKDKSQVQGEIVRMKDVSTRIKAQWGRPQPHIVTQGFRDLLCFCAVNDWVRASCNPGVDFEHIAQYASF